MPNPPRVADRYDDIVRRTVPDPDTSARPSRDQEAVSGEESRDARLHAQLTDRERALYARLAGALLADTGGVGIEVEDATVTLHGAVRDAAAIDELERRARAVPGVEEVVNRLVVDPDRR